MAWIWPRRELRSPITSPMKSSGVVTSTDIIGSISTGSAGLLLVGVVDLHHLAADRLAVGDLRAADVRLDLELALHPVDEHLEVQLAHAGDDRLTGLLVGAYLEGRVLLGEALDGGAEL